MNRLARILIFSAPLGLLSCANLAPLEEQLAAQQQHLSQLQSLNDKLSSDIASTRSDLEGAMEALASRSALQDVVTNVSKLQQRDTAVREQLGQTARKEDLVQLQADVFDLLDVAEAHGGRLQTAELRLDEAVGQTDVLRNSMTDMVGQVEAAQNDVRQIVWTLIAQLEEMRDLMLQSADNLDVQIDNLQGTELGAESSESPEG